MDASEQLAVGTGGSSLAFLQLEQQEASGNFSSPVGGTPTAPGPILVCGYTSQTGVTLATATLRLTIAPAGSTGGGSSGKPPAKPHSQSPEATYGKAIANCDKQRGKRKATCVTKAKLAPALASCERVRGKKPTPAAPPRPGDGIASPDRSGESHLSGSRRPRRTYTQTTGRRRRGTMGLNENAPVPAGYGPDSGRTRGRRGTASSIVLCDRPEVKDA